MPAIKMPNVSRETVPLTAGTAYLVSNGLVIENGRLDLEGGRDKDELHEGELGAPLQHLSLHLHVRSVDPK